MIEAGPDTLSPAFFELDLEVWLVVLKGMADFAVAAGGEGADEEVL